MSAHGNLPAFPTGHALYGGMTLRDWFAGHALVGVMTMLPHLKNVRTQDGNDIDEAALARGSYALADAMLAERANGGAA